MDISELDALNGQSVSDGSEGNTVSNNNPIPVFTTSPDANESTWTVTNLFGVVHHVLSTNWVARLVLNIVLVAVFAYNASQLTPSSTRRWLKRKLRK